MNILAAQPEAEVELEADRHAEKLRETRAKRLLDPSKIPPSMWNAATSTLTLPPALSKAYGDHVQSLGLETLAVSRIPGDSPIGGASPTETHKHFAQAFDGSVARALLAILDPELKVGSTSNKFFISMSGGSALITDAPCGAGAASLGFLCALAQLREAGVVPRLPLNISLVGAEFSPTAQDIAASMTSSLIDHLASQGIFVTPNFVPWNVTDALSTTDLIKTCLRTGSDKCSRLLVIANFNGFLEGSGKRKEAGDQIEELLRYASGQNSFALWIEPNMNAATSSGGLFEWVVKKMKSSWKKFMSADTADGEAEDIYAAMARFNLPLSPGNTARVTLAVLPISLTRAAP